MDVSAGIDVRFGEYTLRLCTDSENLWLTNAGGEGMELSTENVEKMLDQYFTENF